jgi:hypothetical protein
MVLPFYGTASHILTFCLGLSVETHQQTVLHHGGCSLAQATSSASHAKHIDSGAAKPCRGLTVGLKNVILRTFHVLSWLLPANISIYVNDIFEDDMGLFVPAPRTLA